MAEVRIRLAQVADHAADALRVRPRGAHALLRLAHLAGGDHLHRLGDLLRALEARDLHPDFFYARHASVRPGRGELFGDLLQRRLVLRRQQRVRVHRVHQRLVVGPGEGLQPRLERADLLQLHLVHVAVVDGVDRQRHLSNRHRRVLLLLHHLGDALAALDLLARALVEVGGELRERRELAVLRQRQLDAAGQLGHQLGLRRAADARHRDAGVHRRTDAGVEQIALEEDLAVGDRDDVGRHERGDVARLRLDDRQAGQRAGLALHLAAGLLLDVFLVDTRRALQQARVQVEHVARIRFAARRTAQQQRDLAIRPRLLGQVVIDDQRVFAAVHEELAHRTAGIRREILHRRRYGRRGRDDDRVLHRVVLFELAHDVGDRALLLPDRDVDALNAARFLIDDRVDRQRGLAGLAVADDQLALTAADRHHRVHRLIAGLHRLAHGFAEHHARRDALDRRVVIRLDRALAVDRLAERVDHAAEQALADRHFENAPGGLDRVAFGDVLVLPEHHRADRVLLQVQRQAEAATREFQHLAVLHVGEAVDAHDAVGHGHDRADVALLGGARELLDARLDQIADFGGFDCHGSTTFNA